MSNLLFSVKKPISVQSHQIKDSLMLSFNEGEKKNNPTNKTKPNKKPQPIIKICPTFLDWMLHMGSMSN